MRGEIVKIAFQKEKKLFFEGFFFFYYFLGRERKKRGEEPIYIKYYKIGTANG